MTHVLKVDPGKHLNLNDLDMSNGSVHNEYDSLKFRPIMKDPSKAFVIIAFETRFTPRFHLHAGAAAFLSLPTIGPLPPDYCKHETTLECHPTRPRVHAEP